MTQAQIKMETLYERLLTIGLPEKFVRQQALPDWWDEEFEKTPGAAVEAAIYISRRLNLDISSLLEPEATPTFKQSCLAKFKTKKGTTTHELLVTHSMAARIAEMAAFACVFNFKLLPKSAKIIREAILEKRQFVDLEGILEFCCNYGIPVVHFDGFPKSQDKFDGMVAFFNGRPVIVISVNRISPSWLAFILAHELGHVIKDHVNNTVLIDEKIKLESLDIEEIEANEFAVELLLGKPDIRYYFPPYLSGEQMANYAQQFLARDQVDPGAVVLNYAWNKALQATTRKEERIIWATATNALKFLEGNANAPKQINCYTQQYLDLDRLDEDSQDYLNLVLTE